MNLSADVRYAFRRIRQDWRFSIVLVATLIPARRATRVSPMDVMRSE
jgi:hypothetical protein